MQLGRFEQNQWDAAIPTCLLAYRAAIHTSTGQTPAFMTCGREFRLPADIINEPPNWPSNDKKVGYEMQTREAIFRAHEAARTRLALAHKHQKDYYDKKAHSLPFQVGDLVMYKTTPPLSACNKFYRPWEGPFEIIAILNEAACKIRRIGLDEDTGFVAHFNRLKPCIANQLNLDIEAGQIELVEPPSADNEVEVVTSTR